MTHAQNAELLACFPMASFGQAHNAGTAQASNQTCHLWRCILNANIGTVHKFYMNMPKIMPFHGVIIPNVNQQ